MNVKRLMLGILTGLATTAMAHAQSPPTPVPQVQLPTPAQAYPAQTNGPGQLAYDVPGVTHWERHDLKFANCCNGSTGGSEIGYDVYSRAGVSVPVGFNEAIGRNLSPGFTVEGGARTFFFDRANATAWAIDTGLVNTFNSGVGTFASRETFLLKNLLVPNPITGGNPVRRDVAVGIRNYNRTFVSLGVGKEWFQGGQDDCGHWRYGLDVGGRWGSSSIELDRILPHRTDVVGAFYFAGQAAYEFPLWGALGSIGGRAEWSYTYSDILQRSSDTQEINLMLTFAIRF